MSKSITLQQALLIGLIMLSFAYIAEQLYEEYSTLMMESSLASRLFLSSAEKLQRALSQQQTSLNTFKQEILTKTKTSIAPEFFIQKKEENQSLWVKPIKS